MSTSTNKAAAIEVHTRLLPGNLEAPLASVLAPGFHDHDPLTRGTDDAVGLVATMHWLSNAFSDQRVEVLHAVAEGELVALHVAFTARHTGYFRGIAPTGRTFTIHEMHMLRFAQGREVEHWAVRDDATLVALLTGPGPARQG
ncbi:SnoaL-like polyketide cyclase [Sediminihabitans luteus]|uniref:SnoaL-like polyketide cyclase n=1 Tax=Sediminihabitans luteus TaxID=1138585 RepID=A0A2M9CDX9_9CELL|nr:ester cyclase [Sediminihabitans luteus]PJJ70103.1 SnoaL-like polyketide cyclase [Sediminihabitans luteus]GIJ00113.1 hypothetical protein Slu03_24900 [Sediminihabitans luteus]